MSAGRRTEAIKLHTYEIPPPMRGVRVDNELVVIGLYRWEYTFFEHLLGPDDQELLKKYNWEFQGPGEDEFHYWGHNSPAILARRGHPLFDYLLNIFVRTEHNLELASRASKAIVKPGRGEETQ